MAFNKPPMANANVGSWRQRAGTRENEKQKVRSTKNTYAGSRFANQFKPPMGVNTLARIIPGQYKVPRAVELEKGKWGVTQDTCEYYETAEHFDGHTKQSTICSAGPIFFRKAFAQPCLGCRGYFAAPRDSEGRRKGRFGRRDVYIFTVLEYGPFCKVEQVDYNGLVKLSEKTGKPYTEWVRKSELQGATILEEKEGHIQHWTVGKGHLDVIKGYDSIIGQTCTNCNAIGSISRRALLCHKCELDIIDCARTNVPPAEQEKMLTSDIECPECHHRGPLKEFLECAQCNNPKPASVFDVDINMQRLDTPGQTQLVFTSWSKPHPIDPSYKAKLLDLPTIFAPDSLETQERRFRMTFEEAEALGGAEFTEDEARQHTRGYR